MGMHLRVYIQHLPISAINPNSLTEISYSLQRYARTRFYNRFISSLSKTNRLLEIDTKISENPMLNLFYRFSFYKTKNFTDSGNTSISYFSHNRFLKSEKDWTRSRNAINSASRINCFCVR